MSLRSLLALRGTRALEQPPPHCNKPIQTGGRRGQRTFQSTQTGVAAVWWQQHGVPERARQTWVRQSPNFPALKGSKEAAHHPETVYGQEDPESRVLGRQWESSPGMEGVPICLRLVLAWWLPAGLIQATLKPVCLGLQNWARAPKSLSGETHYGAWQVSPLTAQASPATPKYTCGQHRAPQEQWGQLVQLESRGSPNPLLERGAPRGQGTQLTHLLGVVLHLQAIPSPPGLPLLEDRRQLRGNRSPRGNSSLSRSRLQQAPHLSNGVTRPHNWCWSNTAGGGRGHSPTETPGERP